MAIHEYLDSPDLGIKVYFLYIEDHAVFKKIKGPGKGQRTLCFKII